MNWWEKILLAVILCSLPLLLYSEGTKQLRPVYSTTTGSGCFVKVFDGGMASWNADSAHRLNIRIGDTSEIIYFGFGHCKAGNIATANENIPNTNLLATDVAFRIKNPKGIVVYSSIVPTGGTGFIGDNSEAAYNRCIAGPQQIVGSAGYDALAYKPLMTGDYRIEFKNNATPTTFIMFQLFDITVGRNNMEVPGRVWSHYWTLSTPGSGSSLSNIMPFDGSLCTYTNDGIVTKIKFKDFQAYGFNIFCNSKGADTIGTVEQNRQSKTGLSRVLSEYKIFLQPPDESQFPSGQLSCVESFSTTYQCNTNEYCISLKTNRDGIANVLIDINPNGQYDQYYDVMFNAVPVKDNKIECLRWNSRNELGIKIPANRTIRIYASMIAGITHLPVFDVEGCGGIDIDLLRPETDCEGKPLKETLLYWDDTKIGGDAEFVGCSGYCHTWRNLNNKTHNSWWYIINNTSVSSFVTRDTALLLAFNYLNNANGYYYNGDSIALDVFYRNDHYNDSMILAGYSIVSASPQHYNFIVAETQSSFVTSYTNRLRFILTINAKPDSLIDRIGLNVTVNTPMCVRSENLYREGLLSATLQHTNITCYGMKDGKILFSEAHGGSGLYEYSINGGNSWSASGSFDMLPAGSYDIKIRDKKNIANVVTLNAALVLQQPTLLDAVISYNNVAVTDIAVCTGTIPVLSASLSQGHTIFYWKDNNDSIIVGSQQLNAMTDGSYSLYVRNENSCIDSAKVTVTINPLPEIHFLPDNDDSVYLKQKNVPYGVFPQPGISYIWNIDSYGSINGNNIGSTIYINWGGEAVQYAKINVLATDLHTGCTQKDSIAVEIYMLYELYASPPVVVPVSCEGRQDGVIHISALGGEGDIIFRLTKDSAEISCTTIQDQPANFTVFNLGPGLYQLSISNAAIADTITEHIFVSHAAPFAYTIDTIRQIICPEDSAIYEVQMEESAPLIWKNQTGDIISTQQRITIKHSGRYSLHITPTRHCEVYDTIAIYPPPTINLLPEILQQPYCNDLCDGIFHVRYNQDNVIEIVWSKDRKFSTYTILNNYTQDSLCAGIYYFMAIDENGCTFTDSLLLVNTREHCIYIPTAFSPNDDGINDTWEMPKLNTFYPSAMVEVYDRWGRLLFQSSKGYHNPWEGRSNGQKVHIDSYPFIIYLDGKYNDNIITGYITVIW